MTNIKDYMLLSFVKSKCKGVIYINTTEIPIDIQILKLEKKITAIKELREQKRNDANIRLVYSDVHCNVTLEIYERALHELKVQKHNLALQDTYEMLG